MTKDGATAVTIFLEKGARFDGLGWGDFSKIRGGEFVFCTSMSGIEESLTDPSYAGQVLVTTAAHIGNTGFSGEDEESGNIWAEGLVCRHLDHAPSSWRMKKQLGSWLVDEGRFAIAGVDTREFTITLREQGSQRGIIVETSDLDQKTIQNLIEGNIPRMDKRDLTGQVSCHASYELLPQKKTYWPIVSTIQKHKIHKPLHMAVWDFGVKTNTLRILNHLGVAVRVMPATAKSEDLMSAGKDGILLSNGPGDPAAATHIIQELKQLLGKKPLFAICLGHQLVALAAGAKTFKMKFGHRGIHHPVVELNSSGAPKKTWITSQNHGFAVDQDSIPKAARLSFVHGDDGTVEGISYPEYLCETVQFHPEAAPGPFDGVALLSKFISRLSR